ncbi:MAG: hypothetical protein GY951_18110 [Psychromonas sp.]|nr:hypothetical protein [Alteromonadales bacterium]MCP5079946.1 hypothetical protein [Psychromonas sp.]
MDLSNYSMLLQSMQLTMKVTAINEDCSEIYISADFAVKGGHLLVVMGQLLMRSEIKGIFKKVMTGLSS